MADFINDFKFDPNDPDTIAQAAKLYDDAAQAVLAAQGEVGGDALAEEIYQRLLLQLAKVDLLNDEFFQDLNKKANEWYVQFKGNEDNAAKCGAVQSAFVAALLEAQKRQPQVQCEKMKVACEQCKKHLQTLIKAGSQDDALFDKTRETAGVQFELIDSWLQILNDDSKSVIARFKEVQGRFIINQKILMAERNIPREIYDLLADGMMQDKYVEPGFIDCLVDNRMVDVTQQALILYKKIYEQANAVVVLSRPLPPMREEEKAIVAKEVLAKTKELLANELYDNVNISDLKFINQSLAAWEFSTDTEQGRQCAILKEVMSQVLEGMPAYVKCEKLLNACFDYRTHLYEIIDGRAKGNIEVANQQLEVVGEMIQALEDKKQTPDQRVKSFTSLYQDPKKQKILSASSDDASTHFKKSIDTVLLLLQKDTKYRISSLWKTAGDTLKGTVNTTMGGIHSYLQRKK